MTTQEEERLSSSGEVSTSAPVRARPASSDARGALEVASGSMGARRLLEVRCSEDGTRECTRHTQLESEAGEQR